MNDETKRQLIAATVTLDGRPAKISGRLLGYAVVGSLEQPLTSVQYSWEAVARIVEQGGAFRS